MKTPECRRCIRAATTTALITLAALTAGCSDDAAPGAHGPTTTASAANTTPETQLPHDATLNSPPPDGHSAASWHRLRQIDPQVQLIAAAPHGGNQAFDFDGLTEWPAPQLQPDAPTLPDRSADFPPRFAPDADPQSDLPERLGALPPQAALEEAEGWIRRIIKDQYLPVTLRDRLRAVPHVRPEYSAVFVRYEMGSVAIQIAQTRRVIVVVLRSKYIGERNADFGREAFRRFFKDQALARADMQGENSGSANLAAFTIRPRGTQWFNNARWYTDGQALAIQLPKRLPGTPYPGPDAPWF